MRNNAIRLPYPSKYADNGVYQCWICKNCIGSKEFDAEVTDVISTSVNSHTHTRILLPECRIADQYTLWVSQIPCSKFDPEEQITRVMTLDELTSEKDVWLETVGINGKKCICAQTYSACGSELVKFMCNDHCYGFINYNKDRFGGWRCWSARPSDRQREETPWDE